MCTPYALPQSFPSSCQQSCFAPNISKPGTWSWHTRAGCRTTVWRLRDVYGIPRIVLRRHHMVWCLQHKQTHLGKGLKRRLERIGKVQTMTYISDMYNHVHTNTKNEELEQVTQNPKPAVEQPCTIDRRTAEAWNSVGLPWTAETKYAIDELQPTALHLRLVLLIWLGLLVLVLIRIKVLVGAQKSWQLWFPGSRLDRDWSATLLSSQTEEAVVHANAIACTNSLGALAHLRASSGGEHHRKKWQLGMHCCHMSYMVNGCQPSRNLHQRELVPARPFHRRVWTCRHTSFRHGLALQLWDLHIWLHKSKNRPHPIGTTFPSFPGRHWTNNEQTNWYLILPLCCAHCVLNPSRAQVPRCPACMLQS